jgi:2-hydroxy-6-oxonona-2,4-dienedioate hydrolase
MVPTLSQLAPHYHLYAPDLPGFGKSDKPPHALNVCELSDSLAAWIGEIGLQRATLVGNSFGCQVIVDLAVRHPERVKRTVLQGPTMNPRRPAKLLIGLERVLWGCHAPST